MNTFSQDHIIKTYDATADSYAATRIDELSKKHLDRLLLNEFAMLNKRKGICADFGCGPGQTTKFLFDAGVSEIVGIDISPGMITSARSYFPELRFETGDLLALPYSADYFGSAIAFYAIVNFSRDQLDQALSEVNRVLRKGGQFLFSFHLGEGVVHFNEARGISVDIDLYLWQTETILTLLRKNNFRVVDAIERHPYHDIEYPTRRGYVWAEKR